MKKKWLKLLTALASLSLTAGLAACGIFGGDKDDGDNVGGGGSTTMVGGDATCEHSWTAWIEEQGATCQATGRASRTCVLCDGQEEKILDKTAHKYNAENVCEYCGAELAYTAGLAYEKPNYYSNYYVVVGIGTATDSEIVIPAQHAGEPVTKIAKEAFYGNDKITSVIAPSITEIEQDAFYYCDKLQTVEFNSIQEIGQTAFKDCKKLNKITLPKTQLKIGRNAFEGTAYYNSEKNWKNKSLYIGEHLIRVKEDYSDTSFSIKEGTVSIADYALENVSAIESVDFPDNEIRIGSYAFYGCSNWKEFEVADNMILDTSMLVGTSLTKLVAPMKYAIDCVSNSKYNVNIGIPNTLRTLIITKSGYSSSASSAIDFSFSRFQELEYLEHPFQNDTTYNIGFKLYNAYRGLKKLKTLKMPGGRTPNAEVHIGRYFSTDSYEGSVPVTAYENGSKKTYYFPTSLKEITIDGGCVYESMFYGCDNFNSITIKNLLDYGDGDEDNIGNDALANVICENLLIDNSISNLSDISLFKNYERISGVKNLYYLGTLENWFEIEHGTHYVENLYIDGKLIESVEIPEGTITVSEWFANISSIKRAIIPDGATSIGDLAFCNCDSLTEIVIPDSVTSIGNSAFGDCDSLTSVTFGENSQLTSIGNSAFRGCGSVTEIVIPDSVTNIGDSAFSDCTSLTEIVITNSVTSIGYCAFENCSSLTKIHYNAVGSTDVEGNVFWSAGKNGAGIQIMIGAQVKEIPHGLFEGANIISVVFEKCCVCENIGSSAFRLCDNLTEIEIPDSVTSIGDSVFEKCSSLTEIVIPDGVTSVGDSVFYNCSSLTEVVIPDGVTSIGDAAFGGCEGLTSVTFGENSQLTSIGDDAFYYCDNLTEIEIPDSVTSIGNRAFYECEGLTSVTFGENSQLTSIGEDAFRLCKRLMEMEIPKSVTSIGGEAFYSCYSLTVYCEVESQPEDWSLLWNNSNCPVVWDCKNNDVADDGCIYVVVDGVRYALKEGIATVVRQPSSIAEANISETVTYKDAVYPVTNIGDYAFNSCGGLTEIVIPNSVTSIGDEAFMHCRSLTRVTFGENSQLTSIGRSAFSFCDKLTEIEIPDSVTSIGERAFAHCGNLTSITFDGTMEQWNNVTKGYNWNTSVPATKVVCSDGEVAL